MLLPVLLAAVTTTSPPPPDPFLRDYAETRRFMAGRPASPRLTPDGRQVLFLRSGPRSNVQALFELDLSTSSTRELLDAAKLLAGASQSLTKEERAQLERRRVSARGFTRFELSKDGRRVVLGLSGQLYLLERATGAVKALRTGPSPLDPRLSPDGAKLAYVRDHDLHVLDLEGRLLAEVPSAAVEPPFAPTTELLKVGPGEGIWASLVLPRAPAGRPHELLPLAGLTHMVPDPVVVQREWERVARHFAEHL